MLLGAPARLLLAAATSLIVLLVASPAGAATIPGVPLEFSADGTGLTQARHTGLPDGEFDPGTGNYAHAGVCLMINLGMPFGSCGNNPANITPPAVTGTGSQGDPYKLTDTWGGNDFQVTETFTYVNGDDTINAKYAIKNVGGSAQKFRTVVDANLSHAGTTLGQGAYDPTAPASLFGYNDDVGSYGGLVAGPTPWDAYLEASISSFPMMHASDPGGFANTIDPDVVDDWIGVEFDQYTVSGLAAGDTTTVEVNWVFGSYAGLTLATSADSLKTGQTETITATSLAQGLPVAGAPVRYSVTGANPSSGTAVTGPTGATQFALSGANAGTDTVTAFVDPNGNGTYDPDTETQRTTTVTWTAAPAPPPPPAATGPTADQIGATLQTTLTQLRALLRNKPPKVLLSRKAPHANYQALEAGTLTATLQGSVLLAKGEVTFAAAGTKRITLHPTKKGRKLLRRAKHIKATLTLAFAPPTGAPQTKAAAFTMKRSRGR
jgi:hypothetical protein